MPPFKLILFLLFITYIHTDICLFNSSPFKSQFIDKKNDKPGCLNYTVSTFGFMDYQAKHDYALKVFDDVYGCEYNGATQENEQMLDKYHTAYLVKRGNCPYVKKALNVRKAGGTLAIAFHDDPKEDIDNVIPIAPKNIADNVPPVAVINNADGKKLQKIIKEKGDGSVKLSVDFDVEKKTKSKLNLVIWMSPTNRLSYKFLEDFSKYYNDISEHVN